MNIATRDLLQETSLIKSRKGFNFFLHLFLADFLRGLLPEEEVENLLPTKTILPVRYFPGMAQLSIWEKKTLQKIGRKWSHGLYFGGAILQMAKAYKNRLLTPYDLFHACMERELSYEPFEPISVQEATKDAIEITLACGCTFKEEFIALLNAGALPFNIVAINDWLYNIEMWYPILSEAYLPKIKRLKLKKK